MTYRLFRIIVLLTVCSVVRANGDSVVRPNGDRLTLLPSRTTLTGRTSTQPLLVEVERNGKFVGERTAKATFTTSNPEVAVVGKDGIVRGVGDGLATVTARVGALKATASVVVRATKRPAAWSFRNDVLPVLTKTGCNSGACHGAAAGKGGMKLSLRGFDPDTDFDVLTRQADGRRAVAGDPENSLLVLKPTMRVAHGGGRRIEPGSTDYNILSGWIQAKTPRPRWDDPRLQSLDVFPAVASLKPGDDQKILVRAHYSDGRSEDVTRWVKFGSSDNNVATVDDIGQARVLGYGEAAITVWFSSKVTFARIVSPFPAGVPGQRQPQDTAVSGPSAPGGDRFIDALITQKLSALNLPPSPPCTDAEFLRRAFLDAAGLLPTPSETEAFLKVTTTDKREKLVDALLAKPEFVDYWTYKWCDLLLVSSRKMPTQALDAFYAYIRKSVADNKPWDRFVTEILTAQGSNLDNGAANFFVIHKEPIDLTETTTQAFLGMSLMCARCHNHPLERWTQRDYYQMANLFARTRLKNGDRAGEVLVLASDSGNINLPRLGAPLPPRPLDGTEMRVDDPADRRRALALWVTSRENPYFAKACVNRIWRNFLGRGLVEAEDDLRLTNPPSNQELLDALAADFAGHGYDTKRLIRQILLSEAYQRSASPVGINVKDDRYYSHYLVRRLPAEVMLDALSQVTGIPTEFPNLPKGTRALQLKDSQVASYFLTAFGRPEREKTCACERQQAPNVAQALHLSNGDTVNKKLQAAGGMIDRLLEGGATDTEVLKALYLTALCRYPSEDEKKKALAILATGVPVTVGSVIDVRKERRAVLEDLFWAVLTDKEFLFNH